jgi:hypothetical protein
MNFFYTWLGSIAHTSFFRSFIFWLGAIRRLKKFPWLTWDQREPTITHDEIDAIELLIQPGDVGVHFDWGYLSNLFIPGQFKHVWIHVDQHTVIEALAPGVLHHSCHTPLYTDSLVILRPKVSVEVKAAAVQRALDIVGFNYDVAFDFNLSAEFKHLNKHDQAFSCIEVVAYAYYPQFDELGFKWVEHMGKQVIYPSTVVNPAWDVVWSNVPGIPTTV